MTEAEAAVDELFGQGFHTLVIEEFLQGEEASVLALTDGKTIIPLLPAQDHKRIGEGDTGKNTGGMGAYAPAPLVTPEIMQRITTEVLQPTIDTLNQRGIDYRGILYAGLMITPEGEPKVIEFNCRFGDPETQAVLPLLDTPLDELMLACVKGELANTTIKWKSGSAVCVVAAAGGYPDAYQKGKTITGLDTITDTDAIIFHAGTNLEGDRTLTNGGRVLGITASGENLQKAISQVYSAIARIDFEDMYYRKDIAQKASSK
jgi:phosphoribosylamine--glycine ligase